MLRHKPLRLPPQRDPTTLPEAVGRRGMARPARTLGVEVDLDAMCCSTCRAILAHDGDIGTVVAAWRGNKRRGQRHLFRMRFADGCETVFFSDEVRFD